MQSNQIWPLILRTLREPRAVAAWLLGLNLPLQARLLGLGVVMALSAALGTLGEMLFAFVTKLDIGRPTSPVPMAFVQGALVIYGAAAMSFVGQRMGGRGGFADALLLLVWMEFVLVAAQVAQVVVMVFFPVTAVIVSAAILGLMFYLLVQFTAALHGFTNLGKVTMGVLATFFGSALLAGALMVMLGVVPVPAAG